MENATIKRHTVHDSDNSYDKNEQYKQQLNAFNMRILEKNHHWSMKKNQTTKQARTNPKNKLNPPPKIKPINFCVAKIGQNETL